MHWRTREYYPAGTKVHVDAKLYGVPFGDGAFGAQDSTLSFEIGRRQVVIAEASSHRIQVLDAQGAVIMDFPCSYGEGDVDRNVTRSGIHVVTEKYEDFYMTNPAARLRQHPRAVRRADLQQRRVHPRQPGQFGRAGQHQRHQRLHQPVDRVTPSSTSTARSTATRSRSPGRGIQLSYADGDIWDWAIPWDEWVSMSALSDEASPAGIPSTAPATPSGAPQPAAADPAANSVRRTSGYPHSLGPVARDTSPHSSP